MTYDDYRMMAYALLPPGECWPEQPGEFPAFDELINALAHSLEEADARAQDLIPESSITDSDELFPNWEEQYQLPDQYSEENETLEQRKAAVLAKRRKRVTPSIAAFRPIVEGLAPDSVLSHHMYPPFLAGISGSGDACGYGGAGVWSLESMPDIIKSTARYAMSGWDLDAGVSVSDNTHTIPKDATLTADTVTFGAGDQIQTELAAERAETVTVRFVIWAKTADDAVRVLSVRFLMRDGSLSTATNYNICGTWGKVVYEADIEKEDTTTPAVILTSAAGGAYVLGDTHAGERYPKLEARITQLFQLQTEGEFLVHGEGPVYVYDDEGNPLFTDDGDPVTL